MTICYHECSQADMAILCGRCHKGRLGAVAWKWQNASWERRSGIELRYLHKLHFFPAFTAFPASNHRLL